jgi:STE24 endopeptidase
VTEVPEELQGVLSKKTFERTRLYMLERKRFAFVKDLLSIATSTIVVLYEILPLVWDYTEQMNHLDDEVTRSCFWYISFTTLLAIINLPLTLYEIFVIERNYTPRKRNECLLWDKLKTFIWSQIFITIIASILVTLIQKGDEVILATWGMFCAVILLVGLTYPVMAPSRFRHLEILKSAELRSEIVCLAAQLNFPLKEIYVEERFKRSPTQSVYFYGPSNQKNIVLVDSLFLKEDGLGCSDEEILAILSLEFARWYYNHAIKYVLSLEANLLISFSTFFFLFKNPEVFEVFGFRSEQPVLVGVYVVLKYVMAFYSTLLSFCFMYVSRRFVAQSDAFAVRLGKAKALASALVRLDKNNLTFPIYDHLYSIWHHDKPPLVERIAAIMAPRLD